MVILIALLKTIFNLALSNPRLNKTLYNSPREFYYSRTIKQYSSKVFWHKLFNKYNVKSPEIYGIYSNNNFYPLLTNKTKSFPKNKDLIVKAVLGCLGHGIYQVKGDKSNWSKSLQLDSFKEPYLVMKKITNHPKLNFSKSPQHFRLITAKIKNTVKLYDLVYYLEQSTGAIKSNNGNGKYGLNIKNYPFLKKAVRQAKEMHKSLDPLFVAWDVIYSPRGICISRRKCRFWRVGKFFMY